MIDNKVYNINTWVKSPKSYDLYNVIKTYCIDNNLTIHRLESSPCGKDWIDRLIGNNRETVYFHISGGYDKLNNLKFWLENKSK